MEPIGRPIIRTDITVSAPVRGVKERRTIADFSGFFRNVSFFSETRLIFRAWGDIIKGISIDFIRRLFASEQSPTGKIFGGYVFR